MAKKKNAAAKGTQARRTPKSTAADVNPTPREQHARAPAVVLRAGKQAVALVKEYRTQLGARVSAATANLLSADVKALGAAIKGKTSKYSVAKRATTEQRTVIATAQEEIHAVRGLIKANFPVGAVRAAWGVGQQLKPSAVEATRAALDTMIARAAAKPGEVAQANIQPADLALLRDSQARLDAADTTSEALHAEGPASTSARDALAVKVDAEVHQIAASGAMAFVHQPKIQAQFRALTAGGGHGKGKKKNGGSGPTGTGGTGTGTATPPATGTGTTK